MTKLIPKAMTNKVIWIAFVAAINIFLLLLIITKNYDAVRTSGGAIHGIEETYVGKVMLEENLQVIPTGGFRENEAVSEEIDTYHLYHFWQRADTFQDGEYEIHAYQLIEIYKDNQGNVVKRVPTENFNYLRYCPGCSVEGLSPN